MYVRMSVDIWSSVLSLGGLGNTTLEIPCNSDSLRQFSSHGNIFVSKLNEASNITKLIYYTK